MIYSIHYIAKKYGRVLKDSLASEIEREIAKLVRAGFQNPTEFLPSIKINSKKMMAIACEIGVVSTSVVTSKGQYVPLKSIHEITLQLAKNDNAIEIALKSLHLDVGTFPKINSNDFTLNFREAVV